MSENYIYAVARIRSKELTLLSESFMEQLISCKNEGECMKLLNEKGWGTPEMTSEEIFAGEHQETWELIEELVDDMSIFDVFRYSNDYHNLKAAVKETCIAGEHPGIFTEDGTIAAETIMKALETKEYELLPERMQKLAQDAVEQLLHTRDGQLCDCMIDQAALTAIRQAGKATGEELLSQYGELTVVSADIKTAVRAARTGKDRAFLERSIAPCDTLNTEELIEASLEGFDAICNYLEKTKYSDAVEELKKSAAAFERWCDNLMIRAIKPQLYNPFGVGPLAAYILARENEIKTVRIILSAKRNELSEDVIRERVREMYV
ncbi:MAG: V-type ATPase subunit [Lachnospiraceae bacterium]|nr:V-type ATPase subunit [Lachnospiraceae bacterium]